MHLKASTLKPNSVAVPYFTAILFRLQRRRLSLVRPRRRLYRITVQVAAHRNRWPPVQRLRPQPFFWSEIISHFRVEPTGPLRHGRLSASARGCSASSVRLKPVTDEQHQPSDRSCPVTNGLPTIRWTAEHNSHLLVQRVLPLPEQRCTSGYTMTWYKCCHLYEHLCKLYSATSTESIS